MARRGGVACFPGDEQQRYSIPLCALSPKLVSINVASRMVLLHHLYTHNAVLFEIDEQILERIVAYFVTGRMHRSVRIVFKGLDLKPYEPYVLHTDSPPLLVLTRSLASHWMQEILSHNDRGTEKAFLTLARMRLASAGIVGSDAPTPVQIWLEGLLRESKDNRSVAALRAQAQSGPSAWKTNPSPELKAVLDGLWVLQRRLRGGTVAKRMTAIHIANHEIAEHTIDEINARGGNILSKPNRDETPSMTEVALDAGSPASPAVASGTIQRLRSKLRDPETSLCGKYRVLFSLRNVPGEEAHEALIDGLNDSSHLFRHEVAFVLGQRQEPRGVATLSAVLDDASDHPMVRHEAGEALGAIATPECLAPLEAHVDDPVREVAETCRLALERLRYYAQQEEQAKRKEAGEGEGPSAASEEEARRYLSVDPAPAASRSTPTSALRALLLDESAPIFERYRAMFGLRDRGGPEAVEALAAGFGCRSALLKHELAYVLGQMQDPVAIDALERVLRDADEAAMVRHEAAEALGAIADDRCVGLLREHTADPEPIVADSCVVALDVLDSEQRGEFQYADMGLEDEAAEAARARDDAPEGRPIAA